MIRLINAIIHELGHAVAARAIGLSPSGVRWPYIINDDSTQTDERAASFMYGCAQTTIDNIREEIAPNVWRYKPSLRRKLLLVAAAGVASEVLAVHGWIARDAVLNLFEHEDQIGDRIAINEILGRPASSSEWVSLVEESASVLQPFFPALVAEAERLKRFYRQASPRISGVLYDDVLDEIVIRILICERHAA